MYGFLTVGIPGRLYFDGRPVPVRSESEAKLLALLRAAEPHPDVPSDGRVPPRPGELPPNDDIEAMLARGPAEQLSWHRDCVVGRVESAKYVSFAAEMDRVRGRRV